ncbi:MAG: DUF4406 domain-containing protein [Eubacterium sp.]|nr:DUF4406 domain-containing protein [Eubacterium sp.]
MKVYISGAISADPFYQRKFEKAQIALKDEGYEVVNPAVVHGEGLMNTYKEYMDAGLEMLKDCDAIYMLSDWYKSKGSRTEHQYAKAVGLWIAYQ